MKSLFIFVAFLSVAFAGPALAKKDKPLAMTPFEKALIINTDLPVMLVEIKSAPGKAWTNGNPPRTAVKIRALLKGEKASFNMDALWHPLPYDASWAGSDAKKILAKWRQQTLTAPPAKSEWYVVGEIKDKVLHIAPIARYPASQAAHDTLGLLVGAGLKNKEKQDAQAIIEQAARTQRMEQWGSLLAASNPADLFKRADLVALVSLAAMKPARREVEFTFMQIMKQPVNTPQTLRLVGLPDNLYAALHDYSKTLESAKAGFIVFMNLKQSKEGVSYLAPVDPAYAIQPATVKLSETVGIQ